MRDRKSGLGGETAELESGASLMTGSGSESSHPSTRLAACLLLAGGLKPSTLAAATGASPLDLHLTSEATVLEAWLEHCERLSRGDEGPLEVRVIHGRSMPAPATPRQVPLDVRLRMESDGRQYRGPAGVAKDVCADYPEGSTILIAEAARFIAADLSDVVAQHHERDADITVVCNADSSPAGVILARRSTLDLVPRTGFMDLKEQWLTRAVSERLYVRVHRLRDNASYALRTPSEFLEAAGAARACSFLQRSAGCSTAARAPELSPGAVLVDSVVMPGAVVSERCIVVRSIVCAGVRLPPGSTVVDDVVRSATRTGWPLSGRSAERV